MPAVSNLPTSSNAVQIGTVAALPIELNNGIVSYRFIDHALYGVTLESITHYEDQDLSGSFTWQIAQSSDDGTVNGALWNITTSNEDNTESSFGPSAATSPTTPTAVVAVSRSFDSEGRDAIILRWTDIPLPTSGTIDVVCTISLGDNENFARWNINVQRFNGEQDGIDIIEYPILNFIGPIPPRAIVSLGSTGEQNYFALGFPFTNEVNINRVSTHFIDQVRARVLLPDNSLPTLASVNTPLSFWLTASKTTHHPTGDTSGLVSTQPLQFEAIYAGDPQDQSSFGRILYLGTNDTLGFHKKFNRAGKLSGTTLIYSWRHYYYPAWSNYPMIDINSYNRLGNVFYSPYPAIVGCLEAPNSAWWHTVASFYRETFVVPTLSCIPRRYDPERTDLSRGHMWIGSVQYSLIYSGLDLYQKFDTASEDIRNLLEAPIAFCLWQNILKPVSRFNNQTGILNPDSPLSSSVDDGVEQVVRDANATGLRRIACYTEGLTIDVDSGWVSDLLDTNMRMWARDGSPIGEFAVGSTPFRVDLGSALGQNTMVDRMYQGLIAQFGFSGFYVDGVLGGRGEISYDPPNSTRGHIPHGGYYRTDGIRKFFTSLRNKLRTYSEFDSGFLISEGVQEFVHNCVDLTQEAYLLYPNHMALSEEFLYGLGVSDVDIVARHMSPPLWSIVYNEYSQASRLTVPLNKCGRSDNATYHPFTLSEGRIYEGLSSSEWNQLISWNYSTVAISGYLPLVQCVADIFDHRLTSLDAGEPCINFLKMIFKALRDTDWCAQFLSFGSSQLPLNTSIANGSDFSDDFSDDFGPGIINSLSINPCYWARKINPSVLAVSQPPLIGIYHSSVDADFSSDFSNDFANATVTSSFGWGGAHQGFPVASILHSMWRDRQSGDLCLVLMNWTENDSSLRGSFSPHLYDGFGGQFSNDFSDDFDNSRSFRIDRLNEDGTTTEMATGISGSATINCGGTEATISGIEVFLGRVPAYTVQAYRFRLE